MLSAWQLPYLPRLSFTCSEGSPEGFTSSLYTAGTTFDASSRAIFNRLVEFERGSTNIVPALAESWEGSPDGLIYTFKLRKGVKFHTTKDFRPSRDVNADDVLYSFNRQFDPNHPDHKLSGGAYEYFNGMDMPALLKSIEKVDDHTVRFTLNKPEAPFLANLGMDFASVMSAEYAEKMRAAGTPDKIDQNPVGTGLFQLTKYVKDSVIRYKAHPDYWAGKAKIDKLIYSHHSRCRGSFCQTESRRVPRHAVPESGRSRRDEKRRLAWWSWSRKA